MNKTNLIMTSSSSGILDSVDLWFVIDVSGKIIGPMFKGQAVQQYYLVFNLVYAYPWRYAKIS